MRRIGLLFLIIPVVLLLSTCEEFDPQWDGLWVATIGQAVITLDLDKWEGTLTVDNSDPAAEVKLTIAEGKLDGDENTLIAEITSMYQKYQDDTEKHITEPILIVLFVTCPSNPDDLPGCLGLNYPLSASYTIDGDKFTLWGDLILALTNNETHTLTATKK